MKRVTIILVGFLGLVLLMSGCETMGENTKRGAVGGGLVGSIAGGVIGHQSGHGIDGAAIGAGIGALTGGIIGDKIDAREEGEAAAATATTGEKLGISDVIALSKAGLSDAAISHRVAKSGDDRLLADDAGEVLGAPLAGKNLIGHGT